MDVKQLETILPYCLSAFSILATVFIAIYSSRENYRNQINEQIFNQQKKLYMHFLDILLKIQENPYLQFDESIFGELRKLKACFFIFASKECKNHFALILHEIQKTIGDYKNERYNESAIEEDTIRIESDEYALYDIQAEDEHYKDEHKIPNSDIQEIITKIIKSMQRSLGIK